MKTLSLLRHAEAEQPLGVRDFDRSLSGYGSQMVPRLGRRLEQKGFLPDLILSSPAVRTVETAHIMCYELGYPVEFMQLEDEIYRASVDNLLSVIRKVDEEVEHLLLVGHNPGLSELAAFLCINPHQVPTHMATCALLRVQLSVEYWALIESGCGQFNDYDTPENIS